MTHLADMKNLHTFIMSHNPLFKTTSTGITDPNFLPNIVHLDLSYTELTIFESKFLSCCRNVKDLDISDTDVFRISDLGFSTTPNLEKLLLKGSPLMYYENDLLKGLYQLKYLARDT